MVQKHIGSAKILQLHTYIHTYSYCVSHAQLYILLVFVCCLWKAPRVVRGFTYKRILSSSFDDTSNHSLNFQRGRLHIEKERSGIFIVGGPFMFQVEHIGVLNVWNPVHPLDQRDYITAWEEMTDTNRFCIACHIPVSGWHNIVIISVVRRVF